MKTFVRAVVLALLLVAAMVGQTLAADPALQESGSAYTLTGSIQAFDADGNEIKVSYFDRPGLDTVTQLVGNTQNTYLTQTLGPSGGPAMYVSPQTVSGCPAFFPFPYRTLRSPNQILAFDLCFAPRTYLPGSSPGVFGVVVDLVQQVPITDPFTDEVTYETQVFDDWVVTNQYSDTDECHTGDVGMKEPTFAHWDGVTPGHFGVGPEYRVWTDAANGVGMDARVEAHYSRVTPDVSAPLFRFDDRVECAVVERHDALPVVFSCSEPGDLGTGVESCVLTDRSGPVLSGESLDTSVVGTQRYTITATDVAGNVRTRTATYTVNGTNDAPVALDDAYATDEDAALTIATADGVLANDTDLDNDTLEATLVNGPGHGSVDLTSGGGFTYTPDANYNGADSFTYTASDGRLDSATTTVRITVRSVNDAPTIVVTGGSCTSDADPSGTVIVRVADQETAAGSLAATATRPSVQILPNRSVTVSGAGATRTITVNATATKQGGSGIVTLVVSDGSREGTTTVNVVVGTAKDETFPGTAGTDLIAGLAGADTISGAGDIDILCGGQGNDVLRGAGGDDVLYGLGGADTLEGGDGDDRLLGGGGNDTLRGQGGADGFTGGAGADAYADLSGAEGDSQTEAP